MEREVAPLAGAWIEISVTDSLSNYGVVAPLAGAWIEMGVFESRCETENRSLPSRERGLKSFWNPAPIRYPSVAPLAGAWIEINVMDVPVGFAFVAPLAGAWIEI